MNSHVNRPLALTAGIKMDPAIITLHINQAGREYACIAISLPIHKMGNLKTAESQRQSLIL